MGVSSPYSSSPSSPLPPYSLPTNNSNTNLPANPSLNNSSEYSSDGSIYSTSNSSYYSTTASTISNITNYPATTITSPSTINPNNNNTNISGNSSPIPTIAHIPSSTPSITPSDAAATSSTIPNIQITPPQQPPSSVSNEFLETENAIDEIGETLEDLDASIYYARLGELEEVSDVAPHQSYESCQADLMKSVKSLSHSGREFASIARRKSSNKSFGTGARQVAQDVSR